MDAVRGAALVVASWSRLAWLPALCWSALALGAPGSELSIDARAADSPTGEPPFTDDRPDLVLLMLDDWGWRDAGFMGSRFYSTPHMDALAREGLVYEHAYAAAPNCAPSRASLLTGRWTPEHGILTVNSPARGKKGTRRLLLPESRRHLDDGTWTFAMALQELGYATAHVGKWHVSEDPGGHGFDSNFAGGRWGHPPEGYEAPHGLPGTEEAPAGSWLTDLEGDAAIEMLAGAGDRPLFLHWASYAVHTPIQAARGDVAPFLGRPADGGQRNAKYAGMIAAADRQLGRLRAAHAASGRKRPLVIVLTSDNGGLAPITSMEPLTGWKGMLREGGIRVPLVVHGAAWATPGSRSQEPVHHLDLAPTLLALGGSEPVSGIDGRDLARSHEEPRSLYWHFPCYLEGRGFDGDAWRMRPGGALRRGRWKLHQDFESGRLRLFDLVEDPGERTDLAADEPQLTKHLEDDLAAWRERVGAQLPPGPDPGFIAEPVRRSR